MLEFVVDIKVEYEILLHVQAIKEAIEVSETADEVLGDIVNEIYDEKHKSSVRKMNEHNRDFDFENCILKFGNRGTL